MVTSMHRIKMKHLFINFTPFSCRFFITISSRSRSPMNSICSVLLMRPSCCSLSKSPILTQITSLQSVTNNYYRLLSTGQQRFTNENRSSLQPDRNLMRYVDELIDYREKPRRTWLTVIKVLITMFAGVNFGAFMAQLGARLLEKYEIFVRDADDDD